VRMEHTPPESELLTVPGVTKIQYLTDKQCRIYFSGSTDITEVFIRESIERNWRLKEIGLE
jgi:ABC-2 type transport system ATP-binding protein